MALVSARWSVARPQSICRPERSRKQCRNGRLNCAASSEQEAKPAVPKCKTCGIELSKAPGGCDGLGREIGGMGAIPGFGWWPIKAYKPCGSLTAAGISYTRKGQGTNDILFGGASLSDSARGQLDKSK